MKSVYGVCHYIFSGRRVCVIHESYILSAYMRKTYPNTPLSEFRTADTYVRTHGLDALVDDEEEEKDEEV